jgi:hypothetical protein
MYDKEGLHTIKTKKVVKKRFVKVSIPSHSAMTLNDFNNVSESIVLTPLFRLETRNFQPYVSQPSKTIEKHKYRKYFTAVHRDKKYWPSGGLRFFTQNQML